MPSGVRDLVNGMLASVAAMLVGFLLQPWWETMNSISDRIVFIGSTVLGMVMLYSAYHRLTHRTWLTKPIEAIGDRRAYESHLTDLARTHRGRIYWITKTSVWADDQEANGARLALKMEGLKSGRISEMRYILTLHYWHEVIQRESSPERRQRIVAVYISKLRHLISNTSDYELCPPKMVQIIVSRESISRPLERMGIYISGEPSMSETIVGFDDPYGSLVLPRMLVRNQNFVDYSLSWFESEWDLLKSSIFAAMTASDHGDETLALRQTLTSCLNEELEWAARMAASLVPEPSIIDAALRSFSEKGDVTLSCPQKICLSGDYGDMFETCTLTCSISVRPHIRVERLRDEDGLHVILMVGGTEQNSREIAKWPLVAATQRRLANHRFDTGVRITIIPSEMLDKGLGSSGAGSVLLAAAIAIIERRLVSLEDLIREAHALEAQVAAWPCGPQDHASSACGGLRLFEYGGGRLSSTLLNHELLWKRLSFWELPSSRRARDIIPTVVQRHTGTDIREKEALTRTIVDAVLSADWRAVRTAVAREAHLQARTGMLPDSLRELFSSIERLGGAAKMSGAGEAGIVSAFTPDTTILPKIQSRFQAAGAVHLPLSPEVAGIRLE